MTTRTADIQSPPGWRRTVARSVEACSDFLDAWRTLHAGTNAPTLNAEPAHFLATVAALNGQCTPDVTMLHDERQRVRAVLVGRRSHRSLSARIGHVALPSPRLRGLDIVYGGLLSDGSADARAALTACLGDRLRAGALDHVMINRARPDEIVLDALPESRRVTLRVDPPQRHWRRHLPADGDVIASFSRKHRGNARRADRRLVEAFGGDVHLDRITTANEFEPFATAAAALTAAGYQQGLGAGFRNTPVQRRLLDAAADRGELRCYALRAADRVIAMQVGIVHGRVYHLEATAFTPDLADHSPGQVLLVRVLDDLALRGFTALDFGFGDAAYKRIYGNESWEETTVHLFRRHPRATTARCVHEASTFLERQAATHLQWAKRHWRSHLERTR